MLSDTLPVSVVIPVKNRKHLIVKTLQSLVHQQSHPKEVIIVDDHSDDGTWETLRKIKEEYEFPFLFKVIREKNKSKGPATARNRGISSASAPYVAFTDSDCVAAKDWLQQLIKPFLVDNCPKKLVGTGGKVNTYKRDVVGAFYEIMGVLNPPPNLLYLVTANCCYRRNVLEEIGGFNQTFELAGGEDTEISLRLRDRDYFFKYIPSAVIYHNFSSHPKDVVKTFIRYGEGSYLIQKQKRFFTRGTLS